MTETRTFLDTNVLVYASDQRDARKQGIAQAILRTSVPSLVLSTQVLLEFFNAATKKLGADPVAVSALAASYARLMVVELSAQDVLQAMGTSIVFRCSIWDAMIIESAATANCAQLLSEDLQHGQVIRGVRIVNPFL